LKKDKNKNAKDRGDDEGAAEFNENRHEPIHKQGQFRRLKAALLSRMTG
jgi:hypothetical protein